MLKIVQTIIVYLYYIIILLQWDGFYNVSLVSYDQTSYFLELVHLTSVSRYTQSAFQIWTICIG